MNQQTSLIPAACDEDLKRIAGLAEKIWHQHFTPIIGEDQVNYMVEKFQSYPALKKQTENDGYEYYQIFCGQDLAGYTGIHPETDALFLSKLYIHKDFRGRHLATEAFHFLTGLCRERGLKKIWLTCNKHNENTLQIYRHLGFEVTDTQEADIGGGFIMDDYIMTYMIS
ncbi:MAG: GNAT family N-acetyltransferase [Merdimonas faecis]|uniref:GNAT family N-acetyltransferase n=1 Tax=Merdimonas faecis TaxID=1653435 RepID=UPI00399076C5